jgi:glycolate oxidase iron-sulfur subunit
MLTKEKATDLLRCNKCGFCLAHCPIYKVTGIEWTSARGRISLIRSALIDNQLDIKEIKDPVFNCLTCNACVDDCPAGVQTADIIFNTREEIQKSKGDSWVDKLVFRKLLPSPDLLSKATGLLRFSDTVGLRPAARKAGLFRIMGDAGRAESMVPKPLSGTGLGRIRELIQKTEHPKYKAAYFVGCYNGYMDPRDAAATIRILQRHQVEIVIPDFVCCGTPTPAYGNISSARSLAHQNISAVEKLNVEAIVTPCASCSSFLKEYGKLLAGEPEWAERAKTFSSKVRDLSEFILNIGIIKEIGTVKKKVSYHDPCHLVRYQKIKQQPRTILKSIPGLEFIELKEADMCCGAAGTYQLKNWDLSQRVLDRKINNVEKTKSEILVSSCPACMMQLSSGIKKHKLDIQIKSLVGLLDEAISNQ